MFFAGFVLQLDFVEVHSQPGEVVAHRRNERVAAALEIQILEP